MREPVGWDDLTDDLRDRFRTLEERVGIATAIVRATAWSLAFIGGVIAIARVLGVI